MLPQSCWVLLLLLLCAGFGGLGFSTPSEQEELRLETLTQDRLLHPMLDQPCLAKLLEEDIPQQRERDLDLLLAQWERMEEVKEKLQQLNQSLRLMLVAVEDAQSHVENHLQHLHAALHPAGQSPSVTSTCILYGSYLVLLVAFLVSTPPRSITLLFLTSSTFSELLGFPALPTLLALAITGQWLVVASRGGTGRMWLMLPQERPHRLLTSTPDRERDMELLQEELDHMEMSCLQESSCLEKPPGRAGDIPGSAGQVLPIPSGWRTKLDSSGVGPEPVLGAGKHWEPKPHNLSQEVSLLSPRSPCQGLTRAGQRCRKRAPPGQGFCHVHTAG